MHTYTTLRASHPYLTLSSNGRTTGFGPVNWSSNLWGVTKIDTFEYASIEALDRNVEAGG
jgi:hypothetical protein